MNNVSSTARIECAQLLYRLLLLVPSSISPYYIIMNDILANEKVTLMVNHYNVTSI